MKIPENFKKKYDLIGDNLSPENVEAALSELFSVSSRLYKENADLKAELAKLREERANASPAQGADLSAIENKLAEISAKLGAVHTSVNDTLCIANDAVISAKEAENAANDVLEAVKTLGSKLDTVDTSSVTVYEEPAPEIAVLSEEDDIAQDEEMLAAEEEKTIQETKILDSFEDVVPEAEEDTLIIKDEPGAIADDLIRSAGLFDEPEEIEPAPAIEDDDVSARLSDMMTQQPASEPVAEEAPASYNDMKSALDAIRARLKK